MDRDVLFLIIGLIGGALVGLIINYFTHFTANPLAYRYRAWVNKREQDKAKKSVESATRRVALLEMRLKNAERFLNDQTAFIAFITSKFARSFGNGLMAGMIMTLVYVFLIEFWSSIETGFRLSDRAAWPLAVLLAIMPMGAFFSLSFADVRIIAEGILDFEVFKSKTQEQIAELQEVIERGSPQIEDVN